jgi:hypothetical protein
MRNLHVEPFYFVRLPRKARGPKNGRGLCERAASAQAVEFTCHAFLIVLGLVRPIWYDALYDPPMPRGGLLIAII